VLWDSFKSRVLSDVQGLSLEGSSDGDGGGVGIANHVQALGVGCVSERGDGSGPSFRCGRWVDGGRSLPRTAL
jgi:hypothetical protein